MNRTILFLFLAALAGQSSLRAQISADSLLRLAGELREDGAREDFLNRQMAGRVFEAFDDPAALFAERLAIAKRRGNLQHELLRATDLIVAHNAMGQFVTADSLALHYVAMAERLERPESRIALYHEAAKSSFFAQAYADGIRYDSNALKLVDRVDDPVYQDSVTVLLKNFLGKSFNGSGRFVEAAIILTEAIDALKPRDPDGNLLRELYTELGIVYSQIGLYDRAVEYLDYSAETGPNEVQKAQIQINTGRNLILTRDYPAAAERYQKVLAYELPPNYRSSLLSYTYNGLVEVFYRTGATDSLRANFARFAALMETEAAQQQVAPFLFRQSELLHEMARGNSAAALEIGEELYEEAVAKNDPAELLMYTEYLTDIYRERGDFRQAERFTRELMHRKDSIQSVNRNNALLLYYNQFKLQEKENDILRVTAERQQVAASRRLFQTAAGLLGLLLLSGGWLYFRLRKARRQLAGQNEELNRLNATKDRFFGIIAHDLRNPIAALATAGDQVDRLLARGKTERVKAVVDSVSATAVKLNNLLDNLLQWALGQAGAITLRREHLRLAKLVDENFAIYDAAAADKQLQLTQDFPRDTTVLADHNALQTILRNLIGNAVKYSPDEAAATVAVAYHREGQTDVITVTNQGQGISAAAREQLFRLHRGDAGGGRRKSGTGLGLILCRELVELHGGKIGVESTPGEGAVFSVSLPVE